MFFPLLPETKRLKQFNLHEKAVIAIDFSSGVTLVKYFVVGSFLSNLEIDKSP